MDEPATDPKPSDAPHASAARAGRHPRAIGLFLIVVILSAAADLGLKAYAFRFVADTPVTLDATASPYFGVPHHDPTVLIPGVLNLQLTANEGAIFGIGKGSRWVFVIVSLFAVGFVGRIFWMSTARMSWFHVGLALILAGALGNLYDRIRFALVRDMLHLFPNTDLPFGLAWPGGSRGLYPWIFNLADVSLLAGVVIVLWVTWRHAPPKPEAEKARG